MSSLSNWSYTQPLTVWPLEGTDEFGQPIFGAPYILTGTWEEGGDAERDEDGTQFVPDSTYYFEAEDGSSLIPKRDSRIKRGDHTSIATPPNDAERIRTVGGWDMAMFGADELPDWRLMT